MSTIENLRYHWSQNNRGIYLFEMTTTENDLTVAVGVRLGIYLFEMTTTENCLSVY